MPKKIIYAEDAIDAICKVCSMVGDYHKCDGYPETSTWCDELVALRALPSAQPELPSYVAEIEEEYQKAVKSPYIHKPLAKALYEVWKKHDREDAERRTDEAD